MATAEGAGVADRRLAFDLRSQAIRRSSSLGPSAVAASDSRSVCLSSSLNPDVGSRIAAVRLSGALLSTSLTKSCANLYLVTFVDVRKRGGYGPRRTIADKGQPGGRSLLYFAEILHG